MGGEESRRTSLRPSRSALLIGRKPAAEIDEKEENNTTEKLGEEEENVNP
jgi:hypothetical protein